MSDLSIDEVALDFNEGWLIRNALSCYRDTCVKIAAAERAQIETYPEHATTLEHLARGWEDTTKRVDALLEKIG